jgi:hypothetical protein
MIRQLQLKLPERITVPVADGSTLVIFILIRKRKT